MAPMRSATSGRGSSIYALGHDEARQACRELLARRHARHVIAIRLQWTDYAPLRSGSCRNARPVSKGITRAIYTTMDGAVYAGISITTALPATRFSCPSNAIPPREISTTQTALGPNPVRLLAVLLPSAAGNAPIGPTIMPRAPRQESCPPLVEVSRFGAALPAASNTVMLIRLVSSATVDKAAIASCCYLR